MVKVREEKDFVPICPHCERRIEEVVVVKHGFANIHYVYACPHCKKILGVGRS